MAVRNSGYPPAITCAISYREELRRTGNPVYVYLDILGAGREVAFPVRAYEPQAPTFINGEHHNMKPIYLALTNHVHMHLFFFTVNLGHKVQTSEEELLGMSA